jgi:ribosome biogenesis ATPase
LQLITKGLSIDSDIDFDALGRLTPGFVGADLKALASEAGTRAVRRIVALGRPVEEMVGDSRVLQMLAPPPPCATEEGKSASRSPNSAVSWRISPTYPVKNEMEVDSVGPTGDIFCFDEHSLSLQQREAAINTPTNDADKVLPPLSARYVCVPYAGLVVKMQDFTEAIKCIQPTAKREGFAVAPDVTWADVGALAEAMKYWIA